MRLLRSFTHGFLPRPPHKPRPISLLQIRDNLNPSCRPLFAFLWTPLVRLRLPLSLHISPPEGSWLGLIFMYFSLRSFQWISPSRECTLFLCRRILFPVIFSEISLVGGSSSSSFVFHPSCPFAVPFDPVSHEFLDAAGFLELWSNLLLEAFLYGGSPPSPLLEVPLLFLNLQLPEFLVEY